VVLDISEVKSLPIADVLVVLRLKGQALPDEVHTQKVGGKTYLRLWWD
jgi:hypothetical protein